MGLTESEARSFWPVYDPYEKGLARIADRHIKLIEDSARNYETMSGEIAKDILDRYLAIEDDRLKLRKAYLAQFPQVLPEKNVARYYQLENKFQAVVNLQLAASIPLVQ